MKVVSLEKLQKRIRIVLNELMSISDEILVEDTIITNIHTSQRKPRKEKKKRAYIIPKVPPFREKEVITEAKEMQEALHGTMKISESFSKPKRGRHKKFYQDEPVQSEGDPSLK